MKGGGHGLLEHMEATVSLEWEQLSQEKSGY